MTKASIYILFAFFHNVVLEEDGFTCYPNLTIHFTNPNATIYTHHTAVYDVNGTMQDCNSSTDGANYNIYFHCTTTTTVTVYLTDSALEENKLIRGNTMAYKVQCKRISPYIESVSDDIPVSIDVEVGTTMVKVDLKAGFYYYISQEVFQATVGDSLFFAIVGPVEYNLKPIQCNASGGLQTEPAVVITDGCSNDFNLIDSFSNLTEYGKTHYFARLYVFKFFDSDILNMTCLVKVCPGLGCEFNCTDRKKRDLPDTEGSTIDNDTITTVSGRLKILESAIGQSVHFRGSDTLSLVLLTIVLLTSNVEEH